MNFQDRHLLQEDYGQGNKMKYLTGGLAGAGLMAASHIMGAGDDSGDNSGMTHLDDAKDSYDKGTLWNDTVQKGQDALGWLKSDSGNLPSVNPEQTQTPTGTQAYQYSPN